MTRTFLLINLMLLTQLCFGQTTLPNMKIVGNDTLFLVSAKNLRSNNNAIQDLKACNIMADTLYAQKERYKSVNEDLNSQQIINNQIIANQQAQITEKIITETSYKKGEKRAKIKVKILKGFATGFGVIAVIETGWIFLSTLSH